MIEQEVEQQTTDTWVLPGMAVIVTEESRRTSLSMEQRRMLTTPVEKKQSGD